MLCVACACASFLGTLERSPPPRPNLDPHNAANAEEIDIDLNDPEVQAAAATIQAGFRGLQARKEVKAMKEQKDIDAIDLNDPEVQAAAATIQAGFRGLQARKEVKTMKKRSPTPRPNLDPHRPTLDV